MSNETSPEQEKAGFADAARKRYDDNAHKYDDLWNIHVREPNERITRELQLQKGQRICDLACGTGLITLQMMEQTAPGSGVGVDYSSKMIETVAARAKEKGYEFHGIVAKIEDWLAAGDAEGFDAISIRFALSYVHYDEFLPRISSVLKPGGRVGILTNTAASAPQAYSLYTELANEMGMEVQKQPVPPSAKHVAMRLEEGGLVVESCWEHTFRLHFSTGTELIRWLLDTGFVTHPLISSLSQEELDLGIRTFGEAMDTKREAEGVPLDLTFAGVVARKP